MGGATHKADELSKELKSPIFGQFTNPANINAHMLTTTQEILSDLDTVNDFVAGAGTGGTLSGNARILKAKNSNTIIWAVEPSSSPLISKGIAGPHRIQGIGANFIPGKL